MKRFIFLTILAFSIKCFSSPYQDVYIDIPGLEVYEWVDLADKNGEYYNILCIDVLSYSSQIYYKRDSRKSVKYSIIFIFLLLITSLIIIFVVLFKKHKIKVLFQN